MAKKIILGVLFLAAAHAVGENVDEVMQSDKTASEQQLVEAAETMIAEDALKKAAPTQATNQVAVQTPTEAQIPVLKNERSPKAEAPSNWMRLIGSAVFVLVLTAGLIVVIKKVSKQKNIVGKKVRIEVLHQHFLGPKKSVALIQVAGEAVLIGVTDHNINMIKSVALIDDEVDGEPQDFNGFLEEDFTVEQLTAQKSRSRTV